jgi:phosphatidylserine/phosphatidylglycerophosphate/cardiolipin synthase-like enzyme
MNRWRALLTVLLLTWAVGCASLPVNVPHASSQAFAAPEQTALGQFAQQRRAQDRGRSDSGFALLGDVNSAYSARMQLIRAAQKTIDLQYYAVHADGSTEKLLEELRRAARRGVRIRLLLDDFNTVGKDAQVLRLAFEPNVEIRLFNPLAGSRASLIGRVIASAHDAQRIGKRMHNKLFVVDNAVGITGGRNLGDAYFGGDGKSSFVDLDVLALGPIVRDMSASFDRYWNDDLAYPMQTLVDAHDLEQLRSPSRDSSGESSQASPIQSAKATVMPNVAPAPPTGADTGAFDWRQLRFTWAPAVLLQDQPGKVGPDDDEVNAGETVVDGLLELIDGAKQDVLIVSAYFVPGPEMMDHLKHLRQRGVRVRVLTNSLASTDAPAAHAGYVRYRKDLLAIGVELHEMRADQPAGGSGSGSAGSGGNMGLGSTGGGSKGNASRASLHSKAVMIDGRLTVIGSMNLDLRSRTKNSEVALLIRSRTFTQAATTQVENTLAHGAYRLEFHGDHHIVWRAPPGADFKDGTGEPGATLMQRLMAGAVAPFAPDEML